MRTNRVPLRAQATHLHFLLLVRGLLDDLHRLRAALLVHCRAGHALEQVQSVLVLHHAQVGHLALLHDVVRVRLGEAGGLQQAHHLALLHALAVQEELILLVTANGNYGVITCRTPQLFVVVCAHPTVLRRITSSLSTDNRPTNETAGKI